MPYYGLGPVRVLAAADDSGLNPGNLTFAFKNLPFKAAWFECYHMCIPSGLPSGTTLSVFIGQRLFTVAQCQVIADWDPAQPALLQPAQDMYVCTNVPVAQITTPAQEMTAWFRADQIYI